MNEIDLKKREHTSSSLKRDRRGKLKGHSLQEIEDIHGKCLLSNFLFLFGKNGLFSMKICIRRHEIILLVMLRKRVIFSDLVFIYEFFSVFSDIMRN